MAITFGKKKYRQHYVLKTIITAILLCAVFLTLVAYLYTTAENEAYENLHTQTKQIKDDISLQLISDRENLSTMANFAARLYDDNERYDIMFKAFKPIGMIENIGILNSDNTFVTKAGTVDVSGELNFEEEAEKGPYISSRVSDITTRGKEIVRSAVPIVSKGQTVAILYGVIQLDKIGERYNKMAQDLNAQLFIYDKASGDLIIDNVHSELGNISFLKDRKYNEGYSYEQMETTPNGFTSFLSAYRDENAYLHYSTIDEIGWMIAMARYDSQVFAQTIALSHVLLLAFGVMLLVIIIYVSTLMNSERQVNAVTTCASDIRKTLLETSGNNGHIADALKQVCEFAAANNAIFFNTDGEDYFYSMPGYKHILLDEKDKKYFMSELFGYATEFHAINGLAVNILCVKPNDHLAKTNPEFYDFLKNNKIADISFSATINNANHITILCVVNAKRGQQARMLAEKISACFSMALNNKNRLDETQIAATTDSLTGASNRVAYKNDLLVFDVQNAPDFSCIYVDVNELHAINNKFGHAAGDEMLLYIANTLKEVFFEHNVYRMGGDEFLVFCQNTKHSRVQEMIDLFVERLKPRNYHVAIGLSFRTQNTNTEEMVKEAELRMYEAKAQYYQSREQQRITESADEEYVQAQTGILEIDTMLSVIKENYTGIYRVSLDTDKARRILMRGYLNYNENEENFSGLFSRYVAEFVEPDDRRAVTSFLNYDAIRHQLEEGVTPKISYAKIDGESVVLSVYRIGNTDESVSDTLWVFAKK